MLQAPVAASGFGFVPAYSRTGNACYVQTVEFDGADPQPLNILHTPRIGGSNRLYEFDYPEPGPEADVLAQALIDEALPWIEVRSDDEVPDMDYMRKFWERNAGQASWQEAAAYVIFEARYGDLARVPGAAELALAGPVMKDSRT